FASSPSAPWSDHSQLATRGSVSESNYWFAAPESTGGMPPSRVLTAQTRRGTRSRNGHFLFDLTRELRQTLFRYCTNTSRDVPNAWVFGSLLSEEKTDSGGPSLHQG